jgi:hypothetical protein
MNGGPDVTVPDLLAIAIAEPAPGELAQFDVHDDVEGALAGVDVPACSRRSPP